VIALGAFTRLVDAGLGCPDWPLCYGHLMVPTNALDTFKAWAEMIHRYFAGCLSLFVLGIIILSFTKRSRNRTNMILAGMLLFLILYQIMLGQWTVTLKLLPLVVTQHLLGGFLILSTLWLLYLNNHELVTSQRDKSASMTYKGAIVALIILFFQIILGAWTSTNYAALSCPDFPFCFNENPLFNMHLKNAFQVISPIGLNYEGGVLAEPLRQTIHMTHRLGALIFTLYFLIFSIFAIPKIKQNMQLLRSFYWIWGLLSIQICLGLINVFFQLPLISALSHNLVASLLLLSLITLVYHFHIARKKDCL